MTGTQLFLFTISASALLAPFPRTEAQPSKGSVLPREPWNGSPNLSGYSVPLSDGTQSLAPPTGTLKAITLGQGTQNYTCTPSNSTTTTPIPVAIGAEATLFDASPFLELFPSPQTAMPFLDRLPEYLMWLLDLEADLHSELLARYRIPTLGHHYFNAAGQPTFDLGPTGLLVAKKVGGIPAPPDACAGPPAMHNSGAVDWLMLQDVGTGVSNGANQAYRVETAGGKAPPTCSEMGPFQIPYAALYWFYE